MPIRNEAIEFNRARGTYFTQQTLALDVGQMICGKEKMFAVFGAYRYWTNKFGIDPDQPSGPFGFTTESTFVADATAAF